MAPDSRHQFRILCRDFLARLIDIEVLSAGGDIHKLLAQFGAILSAFSLIVAIAIVPRYGLSDLPREKLLVLAWADEQFLFSTTMAVAGLFAVLAWNGVLPDRRESVVLGLLPLRTRTIFGAKVAAIGSALGLSILAVNSFTGLTFPVVLGGFRPMAAFWVANAAGGVFMYASLLAIQGILSQMFPYRLFLRVSNVLQLLILFATLAVYLLAPSYYSLENLNAHQAVTSVLPEFWLFGLFQWLNGNVGHPFNGLAVRALIAVASSASIAAGTLALAYRRNMRRILETPDIPPGEHLHIGARTLRFVAPYMVARPFDRSVFLFTARTIVRSRQHRLILGVYGAVGLAIAFAYAKGLIQSSWQNSWRQVTKPGLMISLVLLSFAVFGARAVFALPAELRANWIFRITAVHRPAAYFAAVRQAMYLVAVAPVCLLWGLIYFAALPGAPAREHLVFLAGGGMLLVELSMYQFRKIPFACSYLPGKSDLSMRLGVYGTLFLIAVNAGASIEVWALEKLDRFIVLAAILFGFAIWARRRTTAFAEAPFNRVEWEELAVEDISVLDLRRDGGWSGDQAYVDAIDPTFGRSFKSRVLKPLLLGATVVLASGAVYEQIGDRRDRLRHPQIGRSYDVGGRTLNIYCSGEGSPAVVFDSGHGQPGYSWILVQREVAKWTRACWYDRAGLGWSDPSPHLNDARVAAQDLHKLLQAATITGPYILVGHSRGGFNVRVFRGLYPSEMAGMVLVDSSHEDVGSRIPDEPARHPPGEAASRFAVHVSNALRLCGLLRLLRDNPGRPEPGFTNDEWTTLAHLKNQPRKLAAAANEGSEFASAEQARAAGGFGDLPVIVLTAGKDLRPRQQAAWVEMMEDLAARSTQGKQYIVERSGHMIQEEAPEAVVSALREILSGFTSLRQTTPIDLRVRP